MDLDGPPKDKRHLRVREAKPFSPVEFSEASACVVFRPRNGNNVEKRFRSWPIETVCRARYEGLPSFDHTTPLSHSMTTPASSFDHQPFFNYRKEAGWDKAERESLRTFWDAGREDDIEGPDVRKDPLTRNPFEVSIPSALSG
jgi:hypothetical protein